MYVYGAQLEAGSFPTSYIKSNSGSTTTRAADVANIPVSAFGYNQKSGTFFAEFSCNDPAQATSNWILSTAGNARLIYNNSATAWAAYDGTNFTGFGNLPQDGTLVKAALGMDSSGSSSVADGVVVNPAGAATPQVNIGYTDTLYIGRLFNASTNQPNGHIKSIKYYPRRLSNAQLQELTQ